MYLQSTLYTAAHVSDKPRLMLTLGRTLNPSEIKVLILIDEDKCRYQSEIGWALTLFMLSLFLSSRAD